MKPVRVVPFRSKVKALQKYVHWLLDAVAFVTDIPQIADAWVSEEAYLTDLGIGKDLPTERLTKLLGVPVGRHDRVWEIAERMRTAEARRPLGEKMIQRLRPLLTRWRDPAVAIRPLSCLGRRGVVLAIRAPTRRARFIEQLGEQIHRWPEVTPGIVTVGKPVNINTPPRPVLATASSYIFCIVLRGRKMPDLSLRVLLQGMALEPEGWWL